ncbi:unnamed protein product [Bemisia tabaci]|uniref:Uncharacterized protein n=1 Tax=Bemisia tabaci TaxID=7038 RepID=A0A9P0ABH9_BEMTA|nr:PREDICTED: uncharacterized protein LOC109034394 [Bemisia tabaci]CAH0388236.1 unnamed protein product [Bemisia tabaci]
MFKYFALKVLPLLLLFYGCGALLSDVANQVDPTTIEPTGEPNTEAPITDRGDQFMTTTPTSTNPIETETERYYPDDEFDKFSFPTTSSTHAPGLGFIPRDCPTDPLPEVFPVQKCVSDRECWPRICCKSEDLSHRYCRTPLPLWEKLPAPKAISTPLQSAVAYMQCTPPLPKKYDLYPKLCRTTFDCFPNLCCQEGDRKVCRPPKKSLLALISSATPQGRNRRWFG